MANIVVTKKWAKKNRDFVIYNYLAEKNCYIRRSKRRIAKKI